MRFHHRLLFPLLFLLLAGCAQQKTGEYFITCDDATLYVECVRTPRSRAQGLMYRDRLDRNWGMIFIWPGEAPRSFWMRNTKIPLSVAFVNSDRVVLNIEDMEPWTENDHNSAAPAQFAVEATQGWFARNGIKPGSVLKFSAPLDDLVRDTVKRANDEAD